MLNVVLRGKRYRVVSRLLPKGVGGTCDPSSNPGKEIVICKTISNPKVVLENLIHELIHACLWDLDESVVLETADCIARTLIKAGVTIDSDETHKRLS